MTTDNAKVVLITGARGGLGNFVTTSFLEAGTFVVGSSQSIDKSDFPHPHFLALPADLSRSGNAVELVNAVVSRHGRIDGLVHLIGGFAGGQQVAETEDATLDRM